MKLTLCILDGVECEEARLVPPSGATMLPGSSVPSDPAVTTGNTTVPTTNTTGHDSKSKWLLCITIIIYQLGVHYFPVSWNDMACSSLN